MHTYIPPPFSQDSTSINSNLQTELPPSEREWVKDISLSAAKPLRKPQSPGGKNISWISRKSLRPYKGKAIFQGIPNPSFQQKMKSTVLIVVLLALTWISSKADNGHQQPLKPGDYSAPNTVPAYPVQTEAQSCRLDLSAELFGGVGEACGRNLDRSRCCPVLAAWLFAAHARSALEIRAPAPASSDLPMMPDDSQKCVNSLQNSLVSRDIHIPQPNSSCDAILCFCGIRLHQISSLSCPAAFNVSEHRNATPTAAVKDLEKNCKNSSYAGCTRCLESLQKVSFSIPRCIKYYYSFFNFISSFLWFLSCLVCFLLFDC